MDNIGKSNSQAAKKKYKLKKEKELKKSRFFSTGRPKIAIIATAIAAFKKSAFVIFTSIVLFL